LPNRNFYLDLGFVDRLLAYLKRTGWAVVTMDEALRRTARGDSGDRFVNFSVDDCYRDTFETVVPLFRRHGVPVALFVTTGIPDGTLPMWCAGLEDVLLNRERVIVDGATVEVATSEAKRDAYARIAAAWDNDAPERHYAAFCADNGVDPQALHWKHAISWEMLEALRDDPLVEIGAHTVSHARISSLSGTDAFAEIDGCRKRLEERLGIAVRHFAFPYGRSGDCGPRDFDLVRQAGYASAATTRKGLVRRSHDPFRLPRNTLDGSHRHLALAELHLVGATGIAARVLGRV
jgi:peptidoglycan/xylan/chitin deacetylase (PgdA/CDA1 family)